MSGYGDQPYELTGFYLAGTDAAVRIDFGDVAEWIPRSQLLDGSESDFAEGVECTVVIPTWLAQKKGLAD